MELNQVHDIQKAYRKVLNTFSYPGKIESLQEEMKHCTYQMECGNAMQIMMYMLLDADTSFCMESTSMKLAQRFSRLTYSVQKEIKDASFVFVTLDSFDKLAGVISNSAMGTLENPQHGATIIVECEKLRKDGNLCLKGPGIQGQTYLGVEGNDAWISSRQEKNAEFPLGVDLLFVDKEGNCVSLPRTTQIERR